MTGFEARSTESDSMTDDSFEVVSPRADHLMESLRGAGYSLPGAVSDLIDNSITAGARNVWLHFHWAGTDSWVSILDDGCGMSESELVDAMRIASRSPREDREADDLGRFGLGLKTASISQARSLTVATRTAVMDVPSIRQWDLDHLASVGEWQLRRPPVEVLGDRAESLLALPHGTHVVWEKLDRLVGEVGADDERARGQFLESLQAVEDHIAMVFHRFMTGRRSISVWLNGQRIAPWDPFLADEDATQQLPAEFLGPAEEIRVTPYVLPHHSRLTAAQHHAAGGPAGWNAQQGFYVYRNRRLLLPGDWLGLTFQKDEHYKLARIRVDLSNSSDYEWDIDVRKSRARPPLRFVDDLLRIARATRRRAVDVYRHRGKTIARTSRSAPTFVWQRRTRGGRVSYIVNREHPLVSGALKSTAISARELRQILRLIEEYVPVQQIWVDMAEGDESQSQPFESAAEPEIVELIRAVYEALINAGSTHEEALARLGRTEVMGNRFELLEPTVRELLEGTRVE